MDMSNLHSFVTDMSGNFAELSNSFKILKIISSTFMLITDMTPVSLIGINITFINF